MHEDLDLRVIERHHDADPQYREALRKRLAAILDGSEAPLRDDAAPAAIAIDLAEDRQARLELEVPGDLPVQFTEEDALMIDLETANLIGERPRGPKRVLVAGLLAAAAAVVLVVGVLVVRGGDDSEIEVPGAPPATVSSTTIDTASTPIDQPIECEPESCPWSPELTAQALDLPIDCNRSFTAPDCGDLAVSPDGTLVAYDTSAETLTWYEDEPRVVPITAELPGSFELVAIGPHDIAYVASAGEQETVAVAPSGAEITRVAWPTRFDMPAFANSSRPTRRPRTWVADGEPCAGDAVGRPRREPDYRHQALPDSERHPCRDRGSSRGTGMAAHGRCPRSGGVRLPIRRRSRDGAPHVGSGRPADQPARTVAGRQHRALLRRGAGGPPATGLATGAGCAARRLVGCRTRCPTGPPHPAGLTSISPKEAAQTTRPVARRKSGEPTDDAHPYRPIRC